MLNLLVTSRCLQASNQPSGATGLAVLPSSVYMLVDMFNSLVVSNKKTN